MRQNRLVITTLCSTLVLGACGGGGGAGSPGQDPQVESLGLLRPAQSDEEMRRSLREGLAQAGYVTGDETLFLEDGEAPGADAPGLGEDFSTTNLQEEGVDEADLVKYDGQYLYVLDRSDGYYGVAPESPQASAIHVLRTDPATPATEEVASIELGSYSGGLYLYEGSASQLISVGDDNQFFAWDSFAVDYYWQDQHTEVRAWDVSDPTAPSAAWNVQIDGSLLTSRRIDNILYLVTRYTPSIEGLLPYPVEDSQVAANRQLIDSTPLAALLPDLVRDDGAPEELLAGTDCYLPNEDFDGIAPPSPSGSLVTVTAINLDAPEQMASICLNSFASGFYASRQSLYITASTSANNTLIHKISLRDGQPEYRASGEVRGYLGTGNPAFLMSEQGEDLRVVSSTWDEVFFPLPVMEVAAEDPPSDDLGRHRLSVLRESADGTRLELVAALPNAERPAHIGKPGEDLYAARFLGERAYLVTFEVIDPLYVLDLSEPEDPRIVGELEIPGFSTLLQPLGGNLLLGVGQHVPSEVPLTQGIKVALFDVADPTQPLELGSEIIGRRGSHSPALYDHHALTVLQRDGIYRVALPVQRHEELGEGEDAGDPWTWYGWSDSGLYQFEVDPATAALTPAGTVISESRDESQPWPERDLLDSRSVLHDEAVFFVLPPAVLSEVWKE